MRVATLKQVVQAQQQARAVAVITCLDDTTQMISTLESLDADDPLDRAILDAFRKDRSQIVEIHGKRQFIQILNCPLRLLIVGAVHIAQALIPMAQACGYAVTLIDPRRAFASPERFPNVALKNEWPDKALGSLGLDSRTAVVTLTHDPKLDEPALVAALDSEVFYVGALGSTRTHRERCKRLTQANVGADKIELIHAPIGLDLGAVSPAEIAVSIMAEITSALRKKDIR